MALLLSPFIFLCVSVSLVAVSQDDITSSSGLNETLSPNTPVTSISPESQNRSVTATQPAVSQDDITSSSGLNETLSPNTPGKPTQTPDNGLTTLAFGVMSFILILIIVMVILVTTVNLRGWCNNTKEGGIKSYGSVISEGHISNIGEKESIMLVSMRTINTDMDTESLRISSIYSTLLDIEDH